MVIHGIILNLFLGRSIPITQWNGVWSTLDPCPIVYRRVWPLVGTGSVNHFPLCSTGIKRRLLATSEEAVYTLVLMTKLVVF